MGEVTMGQGVTGQTTTGASGYRDPDLAATVELLRRENAELKRQLAEVRGEELPPLKARFGKGKTDVACRKCDIVYVAHDGCNDYEGPSQKFVPAYTPSWFGRLFGRKAIPARVKRRCMQCKAVYYERPADAPKVSDP